MLEPLCALPWPRSSATHLHNRFDSSPGCMHLICLAKPCAPAGSWSGIISKAHPDLVPQNLINALTELPYGPFLNAEAATLPIIQVRAPARMQPLAQLLSEDSLRPCMHG